VNDQGRGSPRENEKDRWSPREKKDAMKRTHVLPLKSAFDVAVSGWRVGPLELCDVVSARVITDDFKGMRECLAQLAACGSQGTRKVILHE